MKKENCFHKELISDGLNAECKNCHQVFVKKPKELECEYCDKKAAIAVCSNYAWFGRCNKVQKDDEHREGTVYERSVYGGK